MQLDRMPKFLIWRGPGLLVVNINISLLYSYTVAYVKMLKETEKTKDFVVIIFIIGGISTGRGASLLPPFAMLVMR